MSRGQRRYLRTIFLGIAAMAALVWSAVEQFGIPFAEIRGLFLATVIGVAAVIVAAALLALVWLGLRRLLRRD